MSFIGKIGAALLCLSFGAGLVFPTLGHLLAEKHDHELHQCNAKHCFQVKKDDCSDGDKLIAKKYSAPIPDHSIFLPSLDLNRTFSQAGAISALFGTKKVRGPPVMV